MIADMVNDKKRRSVVTELVIMGRKLNISLVLITQSYFSVPEDFRLNTTHFFLTKTANRRELQQIAISHSSGIDFDKFIRLWRKYTAEQYPSHNPLRFQKSWNRNRG